MLPSVCFVWIRCSQLEIDLWFLVNCNSTSSNVSAIGSMLSSISRAVKKTKIGVSYLLPFPQGKGAGILTNSVITFDLIEFLRSNERQELLKVGQLKRQ